MTDLPISEELATRLQNIAHREEQSVEELLTTLIEKHQKTQLDSAPEEPANILLAIVQAAEKHNLRSEQGDISENADTYITEAIVDHFKERTDK